MRAQHDGLSTRYASHDGCTGFVRARSSDPQRQQLLDSPWEGATRRVSSCLRRGALEGWSDWPLAVVERGRRPRQKQVRLLDKPRPLLVGRSCPMMGGYL